MSDLNTLLDAHESLANAATGDDWHSQPTYTSHRCTAVYPAPELSSEPICECGFPIRPAAHPHDIADASHIAANDPATIRAFIAVAHALDALLYSGTYQTASLEEEGVVTLDPCLFHKAQQARDALKDVLDERP